MTRESQCDAIGSRSGETAVRLFDWTQNAAEIWRGSNSTPRRRITPEMNICERRTLDLICLNRTAGDLSLCLTKRKPFDVFAERLNLKNSRDDRTPLELFLAGVTEWGREC